MSNDLTFGVKIESTGDGSLVADAKAAHEELNGLQKATDEMATSAAKMASQNDEWGKSIWDLNSDHETLRKNLVANAAATAEYKSRMEEASRANADSSKEVSKLLDKYDEQGAKLKQLKADLKALSDAASSGAIGAKDDNRVELAYSKIQQQIKLASGEAAGFGEVASGAMEKAGHSSAAMNREIMVLGHEVMTGNFKRVPGSLMVLAKNAGLSVSALIGLGGVAVGAVAILASFAVAAEAGAAELEAMNRALAMTSDYSGQSVNSLRDSARALSETTQLTIGQSNDLATSIAASGKIGADAFDGVARSVAAYANASGESEAKVTPMMLKLFADPAKGAAELNSTMHFLNATQMERIATLEREGNVGQAQALLADLLNEKLRGQTQEVGFLGKSWSDLKKIASGAWDAMEGKGATATENINKIQEKIASIQADINVWGNSEQRIADLKQLQLQLDTLQADKEKEHAAAADAAADARRIDYDNATMVIARQNSELYKQFEIKEKIARVTGGMMPDAPTDEAVRVDAAKKLEKEGPEGKLLEQAKKFDEQMVQSHEDAFTKTIVKWKAMEDELIKAHLYGTEVRKQHEAAYTALVNDENKKRNDAADAAAAKALINDQARAALRDSAARNSDSTAFAREQKRFEDEVINFQKAYALADLQNKLTLDQQQAFEDERDAIIKAHQERQVMEGQAAFGQQLAQAGTQFRVMFELEKGYRLEQAVIAGYKAIQDAYAWGSTWGGPIGGAGAAMVAFGATAANVMAIQNAKFGGGSGMNGAGGGGGGAPVTTPSPLAPASPSNNTSGNASAVASPQVNHYSITVAGALANPDAGVISYNTMVNTIVPLFKQAMANGHLVDLTLIAA